MAKSTKRSDRRAVVEQMRREQKRAEKRRAYAIVAACVLVALVIIGIGAYPLLKQQQVSSGTLASLGADASQADCQDVTTKPATGSAEHKPEGSTIPYSEAPPAFGPHYPAPAPMARKYYTTDDRPPVEYLVHNLEHGYNILWYDETIAKDSEQRAIVKAISERFKGTAFKDKFIAAPWTSKDGDPFPGGAHVALTHWSMGGTQGNDEGQLGVWQYCAQPSGEAVSQFVEDYPYTDSPEPNAA